jgi:hypothetical protein
LSVSQPELSLPKDGLGLEAGLEDEVPEEVGREVLVERLARAPEREAGVVAGVGDDAVEDVRERLRVKDARRQRVVLAFREVVGRHGGWVGGRGENWGGERL